MRVVRVFLGLGANLGQPLAQIERAIEVLVSDGTLRDLRRSSAYATEYIGPGEQPDYVNLCVCAETSGSPQDLLAATKRIEFEIEGRRRAHMAPRKLDIDLLLFGEEKVDEPGLRLPHPRIRDRRFVLEPLVELDPELRIPPDGVLARDLLRTEDVARQRVRRIETNRSVGRKDGAA